MHNQRLIISPTFAVCFYLFRLSEFTETFHESDQFRRILTKLRRVASRDAIVLATMFAKLYGWDDPNAATFTCLC